MSSRPELKLAPCTFEAAKYAVMNWHYSKRMPSGRLVHIGVWEGGKFIGVVIFGRGATDSIGTAYGASTTEACELVRVALTAHAAPVSRILSVALKVLRATSAGLRLVVSYADPEQAHHGGIYQAGNWVYVGRTSADVKYVDASGKEYHSRSVSPTGLKKQFGRVKQVAKTSDLTAIKTAGKHKYLYPLDDAMRQQIAPLSKPYPKRQAGA